MTTRIHLLLFIAATLVGLNACETDIDQPFYSKPKLTIISHLSPGSWEPQRVYVYSSLSPDDSTSFSTPEDVSVVIKDLDSQEILILPRTTRNNSVYFPVLDNFIMAGHRYSIEASAAGYETVSATTLVPNAPSLSNLSIQNMESLPSDKNEFKQILRYEVSFDLDKNDEETRYYHVVFYNEYKGIPNIRFIVNPEPSDAQLYFNHYDYGVLIDKDDLKSVKRLTFNFLDWTVHDEDLKTVYVELRAVSEEYYRYHSTLARQLIIRQDPFAEPVNIFNNVEGGYGNFSGFTATIFSSNTEE